MAAKSTDSSNRNARSDEGSERDVDDTAPADADETEAGPDAPADEASHDSEDARVITGPGNKTSRSQKRLSISISAGSLALTALIVLLVGAVAAFGWLYYDARQELGARARQAENSAHAEKLSLDYAVNAAAMNFQDLNAWKVKLVAGTSPELKDRLTKAAESMEQVLIPLQWSSTAQPLAAKTRSNTGGIYVVDCFVGVQTKTIQAPDPLQSTATYALTLDSKNNWQITDVGGLGAVVGQP